MAATKYTPETINKILKTLNETGCHSEAYNDAGITKETYYRWHRQHPEFKEKVQQATQKFREDLPEEVKEFTRKKLADVLTNGHSISTTRSSTKRLDHFLPNGTLKWYEIETISDKTETNLGIPQWAYDRVLGKPVHSLDDAIRLIESYGLKPIVKDVDLFREWIIAQTKTQSTEQNNQEQQSTQPSNDPGKGLSNSAAYQIWQALGIPTEVSVSASVSSPALPDTLDSGSEHS